MIDIPTATFLHVQTLNYSVYTVNLHLVSRWLIQNWSMKVEGTPPPALTHFPLTGGWKKILKGTIWVTHQQRIWVLFSNQNSESQGCKQIHCVLLYFVLVCWMSFLSQCWNGLLPEAAAVSQMLTSTTFSYMIYRSPHFHICQSCFTAFA